jgi:hypothetical protein
VTCSSFAADSIECRSLYISWSWIRLTAAGFVLSSPFLPLLLSTRPVLLIAHRFQHEDAQRLKEWVAGERQYTDTLESSKLTKEAQSNLYRLSLHEKDLKNARLSRLADLTDLCAKLREANYENKEAVLKAQAAATAEFEALEKCLLIKKGVLSDHLRAEQVLCVVSSSRTVSSFGWCCVGQGRSGVQSVCATVRRVCSVCSAAEAAHVRRGCR